MHKFLGRINNIHGKPTCVNVLERPRQPLQGICMSCRMAAKKKVVWKALKKQTRGWRGARAILASQPFTLRRRVWLTD